MQRQFSARKARWHAGSSTGEACQHSCTQSHRTISTHASTLYCRYTFDTVHAASKQIGLNADTFLYGMEPLCLLLWWGNLQSVRTGVAKVVDGHRRLLAMVRQGETTADECARRTHES